MSSTLNSLLNFGPNDADTIRKWLIGGASLGAGAGLITSLINYLNGLNKNKKADDDDTLYVYKKAAAVKDHTYLATPTALVGGTLATLGSYALIRKLYTAFKLKEAQAELDRAQKAFITTSGYGVAKKKKKKDKDEEEEQEKSASRRGLTTSEVLLALPILIPALSALAGGTAAYKLLDKNFPTTIKRPSAPKRIEVIEKPDEDQEEYEKTASATEREADSREFLIRLALLTKNASHESDLSNLVAATASGELEAFEKTASTIGFINALDTVKGAAERTDIDPLAEHVAICLLAKKASICEQVGILAASEFADTQTHSYHQACALDEHQQDCLFKAAGCLGRAIRWELSEELGVKAPKNMEKQASIVPGVEDIAMSQLLKLIQNKKNADGDDEIEEGSSSAATDTSGEEADITDEDSPSRRKKKDKVKFISNSKSSRRGFLANIEPDIIDKILTA